MNEALLQADRVHHWHGFTQMADYQPLLVSHAEGNWLIDLDGRRLLDGVSSMWCIVHGHRCTEIDAAIRAQLDRVAQVTSLGMGCDTTARLAGRLAGILPGDLEHVFFSSDGASAVEAAIKMAIQYWHLLARDSPGRVPQPRTAYLALGSAYHGDTTGAVSLGDIAHFHQLFQPLLFEAVRGPCPDTYRLPAGVNRDQALDHYAAQIERLIAEHAKRLAAVVVEPVVQGAAGMIMQPVGLLSRIRSACDQHDVLLIADEVATGFGRTGHLFACQGESVVPDLICLGKGLTGGYLPMAATVARRHVFEAFAGPTAEGRQFFHGHTFGGNPLAAAAALASLDLLQRTQRVEQVRAKFTRMAAGLARLASHRHVGDVRGRGLMFGVELVEDRQARRPFPAAALIGERVCDAALQYGVWVRPLGDVVVLMPPLSISDEEIDLLTSAVVSAVEDVLG